MHRYANKLAVLLLFPIACLAQGGIIGGSGRIGGSGMVGAGVASSAPSIVQPTVAHPLAGDCVYYANPNTCAMPQNVTAGNTLRLLLILDHTGCTFSTPTQSAGTATVGTFTLDGTGSSTDGSYAVYKAPITGSGSATISSGYTVCSTTYEGVFPFEIANDSGLDTGTNPVYYEDGTYCTSCTIASITTATANDLVLYVVMQDYATTYSALTPYTLSGQYSLVTGNENSWLTSNYTEVSAGTVTGSFTSSSGYQFFSMVVAVK